MAEKRKSIVDEALLEAEQISEAFETNAKEILTNAMGSEIEQMVKESLEEDLELDMGDENEEEATDLESDELDLDLGDEGEDNEDDVEINIDLDSEEGDELDLDLDGDEEGGLDLDLDGDDLELDGEEDVEMIDLTAASDAEVINVFKKMGPSDEIQVVRDGDTIDIKDTETDAEYRIELGGESMDMEMDEMAPMEESVIYEIEIDESEYVTEDDMEDIDEMYEDEMYEEEDMEENITRNHANGRRQRRRPDNYPKKFKRPGVRNESRRNRPTMNESQPRISKLLKENTVLKNKSKISESEAEKLRNENKQLVEAVKQLRGKIQEVAVFNSNLTYSVRLMTENATTKEEKVEIIKRMDDAKSLKESKNIYKSLVNEMAKTKAPIKESIENKINETKTSGSAEIKESKVYVNPELDKMKKLWNFDYKY